MPNIRLNLINRSDDRDNNKIVIFQKNKLTDFDEIAVAWKVIQNLDVNWSHPFNFSTEIHIAARDSYGNVSNPMLVYPGQSYEVVTSGSGEVVQLSKDLANSPNEIELHNHLEEGAMDALVYNNGKLLAIKNNLAPLQSAHFEFESAIWIGVVSEVEEGDVMNSAILSDINTKLPLEGITQADIIMTGGGPGPNAKPFTFTLIPTKDETEVEEDNQ